MDSLSVNQSDADAAVASPVLAGVGAGAVMAAGTDQLANQPFGTPMAAAGPPPPPPPTAPIASPLPPIMPTEPPVETTPRMNLVAPTPPTPPPPPPTPPPASMSVAPAPAPRGRLGAILGIIIVILVLGGGGYWWYSQARTAKPVATPKPTAVAIALVPGSPTGLGQVDSQGNTLAEGGTVTSSTVTMKFTLNTRATTGSATPQVEVMPFGQSFTGLTVVSGQAVAADGHDLALTVTDSKLTNGQYHWRARVLVGKTAGAWTTFGSGQTADFVVAAPTTTLAPPTATVAGQAAGSNQTLTVTGNQPVIAGQTGAGDTITIVVGPEDIALSATADASGGWSVTPSSALPSGNHTVQITATNGAGITSQLSFNLTINPVSTSATTPPAKLAPTGDPVGEVSLVALGVLILALAGLRLTRTHE